jgi:DNA-binding transcriptional regulator YdaS (Cro superfamily)
MQGFWQAVLVSGTISELARLIGVKRSVPGNWISRGRVPAEYCPAIERETGVRCELIRPDVPWGVLRGTAPLKKGTKRRSALEPSEA